MSFTIDKVTQLPEQPTPNTLYVVKNPDGLSCNLFISDKDANEMLPVRGSNVGNTFIDSDGTVYNNVIRVKRTVTVVDTDKGSWTVDYSDVNFFKVLGVIPVAYAKGNDLADRNVVCLSNPVFDNRTASGKMMGATVAGLIVNTMIDGVGTIDVYIDGIL